MGRLRTRKARRAVEAIWGEILPSAEGVVAAQRYLKDQEPHGVGDRYLQEERSLLVAALECGYLFNVTRRERPGHAVEPLGPGMRTPARGPSDSDRGHVSSARVRRDRAGD